MSGNADASPVPGAVRVPTGAAAAVMRAAVTCAFAARVPLCLIERASAIPIGIRMTAACAMACAFLAIPKSCPNRAGRQTGEQGQDRNDLADPDLDLRERDVLGAAGGGAGHGRLTVGIASNAACESSIRFAPKAAAHSFFANISGLKSDRYAKREIPASSASNNVRITGT
jgi:hypothetical protein